MRQISIKDSGIGIPENELKEVLVPSIKVPTILEIVLVFISPKVLLIYIREVSKFNRKMELSLL
jgi:hypothetical protein